MAAVSVSDLGSFVGAPTVENVLGTFGDFDQRRTEMTERPTAAETTLRAELAAASEALGSAMRRVDIADAGPAIRESLGEARRALSEVRSAADALLALRECTTDAALLSATASTAIDLVEASLALVQAELDGAFVA